MQTIAEMISLASPTRGFPCVLRLHAEDPCKAPLLEIHAVWNLDDDHELIDDDEACLAALRCVERFVSVGRETLGDPQYPAGTDCRVRLMGNSGEWAMYELNCMDPAEISAAADRFAAAYGRDPIRLV